MRISEDNFIREIKKKNHKALEYIIDEYSGLVNGVIRSVLRPLGNEGAIEECISDVFIGVWENSSKFTGDKSNFKNWIAGISKFKAIDYYRKLKGKVNYEEVTGEEIDNSISIEDEVIAEIDSNEAVNLINKLKEPDRTIFIMKFIYGYSSKKIASLLGLTVSSIDTKVSRGRQKLKSEYVEVKEEMVYE